MKKGAAWISVIGWSLWLVLTLWLAFSQRSSNGDISPYAIVATAVDVGIKVGGVGLSLALCRTYHRGLIIFLAGLCLYALWRYYLGAIILRMSPQLGGLSFREAIADWWHLSTGSARSLLIVLPFFAFNVVSLIYWSTFLLMPRERQ